MTPLEFISSDDLTEGLQFSGTTGRSATNYNPLNLEYRPGSYQDKYGAQPEPTHGGRFAKFPDMMSGYLAGIDQIKIDQKSGLTLGQFVHKFSPPFQNPTEELISQYGRAVGATADTPLSEIPAEKLIVPMLARESSTRIVGKGGGFLAKVGDVVGPSSAEAAEPKGKLQFVGEGDLTQGGGKLQFVGEGDLTQMPEQSPYAGFEGPVYPEAPPGPKLSTPEQTKFRQLEADIEEGRANADTLAQFGMKVEPKHLDQILGVLATPLTYPIHEIGKRTIKPGLEYLFPNTPKEDIDQAEAGLEALAFLGVAPTVIKGLGYLQAAGRTGFYRYAPDFLFREGAKIDLPAPATPLTEAQMARMNEFTKARLMGARATGEAPVTPEEPMVKAPVREPETIPAVSELTPTPAVKEPVMVETVTRSFSPGREMPKYDRPVALVGGQYTVHSDNVKGERLDARGQKAVWIVTDDTTGKIVRGGFDTKKEAVEFAKEYSPAAPEPTPTPAAEPMVTLYRGEYGGEPKQIAEWIKQGKKEAGITEAEGRWFTDNLEDAEWYKKEAGDKGKIIQIKIPKSVADKFKVSNLGGDAAKFSRRPESEYFLSPEVLKDYPDLQPKEPGAGKGLNKEEIVKGLEAKGFHGTIDRLNQGKISLEQAQGELEGTMRPEPLKEAHLDPYETAAELKRQGIGRQESWSRWVQRTSLRPGMDAKDWYKIYDSVSGKKEPYELGSGGPATWQPIKEEAARVKQMAVNAPGKIRDAIETVKQQGTAAWNWYKNPFFATERGFHRILNDYLGQEQIIGYNTKKYLEDRILAAVPDKTTREGITIYMQAGGDEATLKEWAEKVKPQYKKQFEKALQLSDNEKALAREIAQKYVEHLVQLQEAGMLEHGLDNYVNQRWKKEPQNRDELRKFKAEINSGILNQNLENVRKRIIGDYFTGIQAGKTPENLDIGYLYGLYTQSVNKAINARRTMKALSDGVADDGRPLLYPAGKGNVIWGPEEPPAFEGAPATRKADAYLIKPKIKEEDAWDYVPPPDHPAMRKWKWVGKDPNGAPIMLLGDLYMHPKIAKHMRALLERSRIRESAIGRGALAVSREVKGSILSAIPTFFHQVNLTTHAMGHWISPFNAPPIDFSDPIEVLGVKNGLKVYDHNALAEFGEGLAASGRLTQKIPFFGRYAKIYGEYLFQDLIPRWKMKLFKAAYGRNVERYKNKYTDDQIAELSANQANAAFAELPYKSMGRHQSTQDVMNLGFFAPDFLEARGQFLGQALKPGGREQAYALFRLGAGLYLGAVILNYALSGGKDGHWDKPFRVVYGGKEYTLRSIPGDMIHAVSDTMGFIYYRLNPAIVRPLMEGLTHRDAYGRLRSATEQIGDYFKNAVPIPLQPFTSDRQKSIWDGIWQTLGVSSWQYRTVAEKAMMDYHNEWARLNVKDPQKKAEMKVRRDALREFDAGNDVAANALLDKAVAKGTIKESQAEKIGQTATVPQKERSYKSINDIDEQVRIFQMATEEEKDVFEPILNKRLENLWSSKRKTKQKTKEDREHYMKIKEHFEGATQ